MTKADRLGSLNLHLGSSPAGEEPALGSNILRNVVPIIYQITGCFQI